MLNGLSSFPKTKIKMLRNTIASNLFSGPVIFGGSLRIFSLWVSGTSECWHLGFRLNFHTRLVFGRFALANFRKNRTFLIVLAMPLFYVGWNFNYWFLKFRTIVAGILVRLILSLTVIKLLQKNR